MTGERALVAVISIFWIIAALTVMPGVLLLGNAIVTNEDNPDLWPQIIRGVVSSLWFAVPAVFLARGSRVARGFAIFLSLGGVGVSLALAMGIIAAGAPAYLALLLAAFVALPFLFSTWALVFYRDLREALAQRSEKWKAAEKARLQELEDAMREPSEK
jgi:hypothetical protein